MLNTRQAQIIERLRAGLNEIAHHYIDSALASREKRRMAQRALDDATESSMDKLLSHPREIPGPWGRP